MNTKTYNRDGKKPWSLAPLWISPSIPEAIAEYKYLTGEPRNEYIAKLLEADHPKLLKLIEQIKRDRELEKQR